MNPRVTQADIARRAGVHRATVSLCLRNSPSISETTRRQIQELAKEMGYQPDPVLQALMAYRSEQLSNRQEITIAYITNWSSRWGWRGAAAHSSFFAGATRRAGQLGYKLDHFWLGEPELSQRRMNEILLSRGINCIILASHVQGHSEPLEFDWPKFSAVKIDFLPHHPVLHSITNDQRTVIQLAVRQVAAAGYRRIGFVMPHRWDELVDFAWSAGFLAEQARLPKTGRLPIHLLPDPAEIESAPAKGAAKAASLSAFQRWFERNRPDVIVSHLPYVAPYLSRLGLKVPADVAYADIFVEKPDGKTAGVLQNSERVGELAVEILAGQLLQNIRGIPQVATATLVEGAWIDGETLPFQNSLKGVPNASRGESYGESGAN